MLQGKRTEDQVLLEFLETFEAHHNLRMNEQSDGRVTVEEFVEYYRNISCSVDNEEYFALIINNSWNVKGDATTYQTYKKGWKMEDEEASAMSEPLEFRHPPQQVQRSGQMSADNPLATTGRFYTDRASASKGNTTGVK